MTTFSPITGYGLTPETIGAAPTTTSPLVGSAALGAPVNAPLPPDPMGGGALPNAAVPTGFDPAAYLPDGNGGYIQPPVTDMGMVAGPVASSPSASYMDPAASSGGGPVGQSSWNADYGNAFARAFVNAGVSPAVASAALHTLAANAPTVAELEESLQYLSTQEGMELAPYLAENLAKSAPGYAALGSEPSMGPALDMPIDGADPTAFPADPTGMPGDPVAGMPTDGGMPGMPGAPGAAGGIEIVGQNEDGTYVLSDGRTIVGQTEDGMLVVDDGSVLDQEGNEIAPAGSVPLGPEGEAGAPGAPGEPEIDPTTGLPIDPNAAETGAEGEAATEGGGMPSFLVTAAGLGGAGLAAASVTAKIRNGTWDPRKAFRADPKPATPVVDEPRVTAPTSSESKLARREQQAARLQQRIQDPSVKPEVRAKYAQLLEKVNEEIRVAKGGTRTPVVDTPSSSRLPLKVGVQPMPEGLQRILERNPGAADVVRAAPGARADAATGPARARPDFVSLNGVRQFEPSQSNRPPRRAASRAEGKPGADLPIIKTVDPAAVRRAEQEAAEASARKMQSDADLRMWNRTGRVVHHPDIAKFAAALDSGANPGGAGLARAGTELLEGVARAR